MDQVASPIYSDINEGKTVYISSINEYLNQPITNYYPEPCCEALIVPFKQNHPTVSGYLVAGISPRKKLDTDYKNFIENVGIQMGLCFNSAATFEEFLQLEQEKDNLLSIISHKLKTPITGIKAYVLYSLKQISL